MGLYHGDYHEGELTESRAKVLESVLQELGASAEAFECEDEETGERTGKWAVDVQGNIGHQHFIVAWPEIPIRVLASHSGMVPIEELNSVRDACNRIATRVVG